jgi:hypothetical protein
MERLKELNNEIDCVINALSECEIAPKNKEARSLMGVASIKVREALYILLTERNKLNCNTDFFYYQQETAEGQDQPSELIIKLDPT